MKLIYVGFFLAKTLMGQAVKEFGEGNARDADQFVEGIETSVLGECEKMRRTMKEICDLEHECKHFQKLETKLREKVCSRSVSQRLEAFTGAQASLCFVR